MGRHGELLTITFRWMRIRVKPVDTPGLGKQREKSRRIGQNKSQGGPARMLKIKEVGSLTEGLDEKKHGMTK